MAPNGQKPLIKYLICLLLAGITLAAFAGVDNAGFITFDDGNYVVNHPAVQQGFSWKSLKWAFSSFDSCNWHPLTWLSLMLDYHLFGLDASGYHLVNLTFHIANTVLLFLFLQNLTSRLWASAFVALLFGIHPMHVESVAWVSERKDVMSSFFFLLTLIAYAKYAVAGGKQTSGEVVAPEKSAPVNKRAKHDPRPAAVPSPLPSNGRGEGQGEVRVRANGNPGYLPRCSAGMADSQSPRWLLYALTLFFFALGLLAKPMLVTLPFVLLLLDFWPLQRFTILTGPGQNKKGAPAASKRSEDGSRRSWGKSDQRLLTEKIPFFILSGLSCYITYLAQKSGGAIIQAAEHPVLLRISHLSTAYAWYILKLFWPVRLSIFYPLWNQMFVFEVLFAFLALLGITVFAFRIARKYPYFLFGWLWFLGIMVPVIGLVQVGSQAYADRYAYLPYVGLFIILAWGIPDVLAKIFKSPAPSSRMSQPEEALTQLPDDPKTKIVQSVQLPAEQRENLQSAIRNPQRVIWAAAALVAITCFIRTIHEVTYWKDGVTLFGRAVALDPKNEAAWTLMGAGYCNRNDNTNALECINRALALNQKFYLAWQYMGYIHTQEGDYDRAAQAYQNALKYTHFSGTHRDIYNNLGEIFRRATNYDSAISAYQSSLAISSNQPVIQVALGQCLLANKQPEQAAAAFQAAIDLDPAAGEAQLGLGMCLASAGRDADALGHFRAAVQADTNSVMALNNLAWTLAANADPTLRDGHQAVPLAERACQLSHYQDAQSIGTLAAAYAEAGRFDDAIATARKAHDVAQAHGQHDLADQNAQLLKQYEAHKAFHVGDAK